MKKTITLALALSLAAAPALARDNTSGPTGTKAQCDKLADAFITGQELRGRLRGCRTSVCNQQRADIDRVLSEIAAAFERLKCPKTEGVISYMTPEHAAVRFA